MTSSPPELESDGGVLFELGQRVTTTGALALIELGVIYPDLLLRRHQMGDWGDVDERNREANNAALTTGGPLFSRYGRIMVITRADRSTTMILLSEEGHDDGLPG